MKNPLIVSMASYPPRINTVAKCLQNILAQTVKPDRVLLWLYEGEFPNRYDDLPKDLLDLEGDVLSICWAPINLKPHNKYFWTFKEHPEAAVITVDDDLAFAPNMIEELLNLHYEFPAAVIANRTHLILSRADGALAPYGEWLPEQDAIIGRPSYALLGTNGAGTLFPAGAIPAEGLDADEIRRTCLTADDLWLKLIELKAGVPVVATGHSDLTYLPDTQDCGLWLTVNIDGGNDKVLARLGDAFRPYTQELLASMCDDCASVFARYKSYRIDSRCLAAARRAQLTAEQKMAGVERLLQESKETAERNANEAAERIESLHDKLGALAEECRREQEEIASLKAQCAKYQERLKTPYLIRAGLNCCRRIKRRIIGKR